MEIENKEQVMREAADSYLCCFCGQCPRHEQCLRWEVGLYADRSRHLMRCINPRYKAADDGTCTFFRDNTPQLMPVGMRKQFYREMPAYKATAIRRRLIHHNCKRTYYMYHNGLKPITPDYYELIATVCKSEGWDGPLLFDGEVFDYVW